MAKQRLELDITEEAETMLVDTEMYPVQKYRTRSNCSHALQIFFLRYIRITN